MTILFSNTNPEQVQVRSDLSEKYIKIKGSNGRYWLSLQSSILDSLGDLLFKSIKINCFKVNSSQDTSLLGTKTFRLKKIPKPQLRIGVQTINKLPDTISLKQLKINPRLTPYYSSDFPISITSKISSSKVVAISSYSNGPFVFNVHGNSLDYFLKSPKLGPGTILQIKDISAIGPDGRGFFLDDVSLVLSE